MTDSGQWVYGPGMALSLARQCAQHADMASLLAPLQPGQPQAKRITSLRDAMFSGAIVNESEQRGAGHWALRLAAGVDQAPGTSPRATRFAPHGQDLLPQMRDAYVRSRRIADAVRDGSMRASSGERFRHVVHLGIGGSDIGPKLLIDSLGSARDSDINAVFLSNLDYHAVQHALMQLDAQSTMVVMASKSFTTQETMHNARHLLQWMQSQGVPQPLDHFIAVTTRVERAYQWGIAAERVLWFDDSIGGRFSLWGPVSLTARIMLGNERMDDFIRGGLEMDAHFLSEPLHQNLPAVLAAADAYNLRTLGLPTLMVSAYDSRLEQLVPYLKQLWMESLGKSVDRHGQPLHGPACPILWGDIGTNAQHAFFQLLHQGREGVAIELIGVCTPQHESIDSHHALLSNLVAQAQALSCGHADSDPAKSCRGQHPVKLLMLENFDAVTLGALVALWEHRVICLAAWSDVNPFDQWGVELGKSIAASAYVALSSNAAATASAPLDDISVALIDWLKSRR